MPAQYTRVPIVCENCGSIFWVKAARARLYNPRFCSRACLRFRSPAWFWQQVNQGDGCWEWQGPCFARFGYGRVRWHGERYPAHRLAWLLTYGPIADGLEVLHRCDNPPCCRPDHLFLGTKADNCHDRHAKGRTATGERHGHHRSRRVA